MAFSLTLPDSRPLIRAAESADADEWDADRAAEVLRRDVERWSRWALGVGSFVVGAGGSFLATGFVGTIAMLGGSPAAVDVLALAACAIAGVAGLVMLVALWRSGRRTARAAAWWLRLPYRTGRQRSGVGWVHARAVNLEARILARIATASLALLLAVFGLSVVVRDLVEGVTSLTAAAAVLGLLSLAAGVGQLGGVMRIVSGMSERDPLWVRIRSFAGPSGSSS